jgi:hypothetical protein
MWWAVRCSACCWHGWLALPWTLWNASSVERVDVAVTRSFALTWDYRCPYARIAHDHVVTGLQGGANWNVTFLPFSLGQSHVEHGQPDVWDEPHRDTGLFALQVGVAVRDHFPDQFLDVHDGLFSLRHRRGGSLQSRDQLSTVLTEAGVDSTTVFEVVDSGSALATIKHEHTTYARSHHVWGVPTFVVGDAAVFVRLLDPASGDSDLAIATVERILDQIDWPILNELKHTSVPR